MTTGNEWQDTQQSVPTEEQAPANGTGSAREHGQADDFANTEMFAPSRLGPELWSEAADGRCSETAALFAASQPAPLNIV